MKPANGGLPPAPDSGWSYMVLIGACLSFGSRGWMIRGNGLIYQELCERFGRSATETALVFTLYQIFISIGGPVGSLICIKFGVRKTMAVASFSSCLGLLASAFAPNIYVIYLTYGILLGLSVSAMDMATVIILTQYFDKKRAMALGIATAALPGGGLVLTPLLIVLFQEYGYSGCFIILSPIFLHGFVSTLLYLPLQWAKIKYSDQELHFVIAENGSAVLEDETITEPMNNTKSRATYEQNTTKVSSLHHLKQMEVLGFNIWTISFFFAVFICLTFFAVFLKEQNTSQDHIAIFIAVDSAVGILSRVLAGFLFDLKWVKARRLLIFVVMVSCCTVWFAVIPVMPTILSVMSACIMVTVFVSQIDVQQVTVLGDLVERNQLAAAIGHNRFFKGLGMAIAPAFGGLIKDWFAKYEYLFIMASGSAMLGIICLVTTNYRRLIKAMSLEKAVPSRHLTN